MIGLKINSYSRECRLLVHLLSNIGLFNSDFQWAAGLHGFSYLVQDRLKCIVHHIIEVWTKLKIKDMYLSSGNVAFEKAKSLLEEKCHADFVKFV